VIEEFTTERLTGRRLSVDDFADLHALHQDAQVMAWLSIDGGVLTEEQTRQMLERGLEHWRAHDFGLWTLRTRDGNRFVGRAGLRRMMVEGCEEIELSYALGSDWWGQGLATEIGQAVVRLVFEALPIQSLATYTLPHNRASRRVMEKLGFVYERDIIHAQLPHVLYRLQRTRTSSMPPAPSTTAPLAQGAAARRHFLSCAQVRELDRRAVAEYGMSSLILMENAGRGAAEILLALGVHGPVAICCGKGNNGGDGLVIARHLLNAEIDVGIHLFAPPQNLTADADANLKAVQLAGASVEIWTTPDFSRLAAEFARAEWVVDALYGTGLQGAVRPPLDRVIAVMNASPARRFAVDIPSGLDGDTGEPQGATVRADHTATFVAPKIGFANPAAAAWLGEVHVIDIGVPRQLLESSVNS